MKPNISNRAILLSSVLLLSQLSLDAKMTSNEKKGFYSAKAAVQICSRFTTVNKLKYAVKKIQTYNQKSENALKLYPNVKSEMVKSSIVTAQDKRPSKETKSIGEWFDACDAVLTAHTKVLIAQEKEKQAKQLEIDFANNFSNVPAMCRQMESDLKSKKSTQNMGVKDKIAVYHQAKQIVLAHPMYKDFKNKAFIKGSNRSVDAWIVHCDAVEAKLSR